MSAKGFVSTLEVAPRLGQHHFAHLRTLAEGLAGVEAAQRYLSVESVVRQPRRNVR